MAAIRSRPVTSVVSPIASAAATDGLLMCTIDSLCVSSYSSACENAPFANAAIVTFTRSPVPKTRHGPAADIATAATRTDRPNGVSAPASASPMTSRTRSFVARTTSAGRSSNVTRAAHRARSEEIGIRIEYFRHGNRGNGNENPERRHGGMVRDAAASNDIPDDVRHEALRAIVNIVGCAVGGSTHPAVDIALRALGPFSGPATAQPLARPSASTRCSRRS